MERNTAAKKNLLSFGMGLIGLQLFAIATCKI
jgi:hypothetical protein